jgi:Photosynthesis system II assembly factor YCF48/Putative zinc-finger
MTHLPKLALRRLDDKAAATGIHPDPNLISAFSENALPRDTRSQVMQHLAQCADCREVVFLSSPDQAATLPSPVATPSTWLTWPVLRWGAAAAAVVVVVAAVSLHRPTGGSTKSSGAIQMTDAPIAKEKIAVPALPEEKYEMATATKNAPVSSVTSTTVDEGQSLGKPTKKSPIMAGSPALAQRSQALRAKAADGSDELANNQTVEVAAKSINAEASQAVPGKAKEAATEPASNVGGQIGGGVIPDASAALQSRLAMSVPAVAPRWTLTADGTLQRSVDFGRTWQSIPVAGQASFRALAASGRDIWVGGSKGALYHSADGGQNWIQVQPVAAGQALADDIIGVEFPDSQHGRLTTSSNETWTTEDGGQSWHKL